MTWVYNIPADQLVEPFGKIRLLYPTRAGAETMRVQAYIPAEPSLERVQTALVLDGSMSMLPWYGRYGEYTANLMGREAVKIGTFLAAKVDIERQTSLYYMAAGHQGREIEELGRLNAAEIEQVSFSGPAVYGDGTQLRPVIEQFVAGCPPDLELGLGVILTDGYLNDIEPVVDYTRRLVAQIERGDRPPLKFVLIGVGEMVDTHRLSRLDTLSIDPERDLWDFRLERDLKTPAQIFTEVVLRDPAKKERVAESGYVTDAGGEIIPQADYRDAGVPALLDFELPLESEGFVLHRQDEEGGYIDEQPFTLPEILEQPAAVQENVFDRLEIFQTST